MGCGTKRARKGLSRIATDIEKLTKLENKLEEILKEFKSGKIKKEEFKVKIKLIEEQIKPITRRISCFSYKLEKAKKLL